MKLKLKTMILLRWIKNYKTYSFSSPVEWLKTTQLLLLLYYCSIIVLLLYYYIVVLFQWSIIELLLMKILHHVIWCKVIYLISDKYGPIKDLIIANPAMSVYNKSNLNFCNISLFIHPFLSGRGINLNVRKILSSYW